MDDNTTNNPLTQHHQQHQILQQQQQQQLLLQQLQHQKQQAMSRFPSNIDAHLRTPGLRPMLNANSSQQQQLNSNLASNANPNSGVELQNQRMGRPSGNQNQIQIQSEVMLAYQDALRVCRPDFKTGFVSVEDACERLLPYHVVADYEAEEDDRILDSDTTGKMLSRPQQWDNNIAAKVADFTATFEKQVYAFNLICKKRGQGEFRAEERLMVEQALFQEEKRALLQLRAEMETREKAGLEAKMRTAAMAHAQSQIHAEMMARGAIRAGASMGHAVVEQEHGGNQDSVMNGWGHHGQRDDEPAEDFLNENENGDGDAGGQDGEWMEARRFDLNSRHVINQK